MQTVYFKKLKSDITIPEYQTENAVGFDIKSAQRATVKSGEYKVISTGLAIEMPNCLELQIRSRSGLAAKNGVFVLNSPATIDPDYKGEIKVILANMSEEDFEIKRGDRIAQGVFEEKILVDIKTTTKLSISRMVSIA